MKISVTEKYEYLLKLRNIMNLNAKNANHLHCCSKRDFRFSSFFSENL